MEQFKPSAKIIADSITQWGNRLTTLEVQIHRFVLAELNTHRVFSRNSASSRAIPYVKIRNRVVENTAYPVNWASEQKGMQGGSELENEFLNVSKVMWDEARNEAVHRADVLHEMGLHKSLINRLLEPFAVHTCIITATEWDNFFSQRCHPDAQPEMKAVADAMQRAYYTSEPKELANGEWHLPYIHGVDWIEAPGPAGSVDGKYRYVLDMLKKVSVARCARVSYLTHDGTRSLEKDIELYEKLVGSGHWSPFEHVATPMGENMWSGNFRGWKQFRKEFRNENRTSFIPNLPELAHIRTMLEAGIKTGGTE